MEDLYDIGYIIFIIIIFLFSIVKNMAKRKKNAPAPRQTTPPPATPQRPAGEDYIERKLAELLGFDITQPEKPKPGPVAQPLPKKVPAATQTRVIPEPKKKPELPVKKKKTPAMASKFRERIIWAEILAPPRARRRGRAV